MFQKYKSVIRWLFVDVSSVVPYRCNSEFKGVRGGGDEVGGEGVVAEGGDAAETHLPEVEVDVGSAVGAVGLVCGLLQLKGVLVVRVAVKHLSGDREGGGGELLGGGGYADSVAVGIQDTEPFETAVGAGFLRADHGVVVLVDDILGVVTDHCGTPAVTVAVERTLSVKVYQ